MIAYRVQEAAFGGLHPDAVRLLSHLARGEKPSMEMKRRLKPGTVLVREYQGERPNGTPSRSQPTATSGRAPPIRISRPSRAPLRVPRGEGRGSSDCEAGVAEAGRPPVHQTRRSSVRRGDPAGRHGRNGADRSREHQP
jgi:hypothetical protein